MFGTISFLGLSLILHLFYFYHFSCFQASLKLKAPLPHLCQDGRIIPSTIAPRTELLPSSPVSSLYSSILTKLSSNLYFFFIVYIFSFQESQRQPSFWVFFHVSPVFFFCNVSVWRNEKSDITERIEFRALSLSVQ